MNAQNYKTMQLESRPYEYCSELPVIYYDEVRLHLLRH